MSLANTLRELLKSGQAGSQEQICKEMEKLGFDVNQSKISRLLRKINAVKQVNVNGLVTYSLPREPAPPLLNTQLKDLIVDVFSNETMVIIFTSPGSASMVARILDYNQPNTEILGTIAGDDTIFVAPKSIKNISLLLNEIKILFGGN